LLKNGATPSFIEFKDENENVVASINTSGSILASGITSTGTTVVQQSLEKVISNITLNGVTNIDLLSSAIFNCSSSADFTFNLRGNSTTSLNNLMQVNQSITSTIFVTNTTARSLSAINIDGSAQSIKWLGGSSIPGSENSVDIYTITIIKTASATYGVYVSKTRFA
jgi:hypothetical protein